MRAGRRETRRVLETLVMVFATTVEISILLGSLLAIRTLLTRTDNPLLAGLCLCVSLPTLLVLPAVCAWRWGDWAPARLVYLPFVLAIALERCA